MLNNLCKTCLSSMKCKYCLDHCIKNGTIMFMNINICDICGEYNTCNFCKKYGEIKGKQHYKNFIEYVKIFN